MVVTLKLTSDHLKLIPFILIKDEDDKFLAIDKERMLTLQSTLIEDVSLILGLRDQAIPNTENDANGRAFPSEVEAYMLSVYNYVKDNLFHIERLIHQTAIYGGISEGIYRCDDRDGFWEKVNEEEH